jgi:subtilisin
MKKLLVIVLLLAGLTAPAHANTPTVAIIDVGFNTASFTNNVVHEVCIVSVALCPNGTRQQEGTGAATVAANSLPAFAHGTNMLSVLTSVNPDAKVVLIRILGLNTNGKAGAYTIDDVTNALKWVVNNYSRLNIKAVSVSQGKVNGACRATPDLVNSVKTLTAANVAVIASTGNEKNRTNMAVPACIDEVISVGATDNPEVRDTGKGWDVSATPTIALYSSGSASTDFYTNGRFFHTAMNGTRQFSVGTSNATAAFAGMWMKNLRPTIAETYASFSATATTTSNQWLTGRYVLIP